MKRRLAKKIIDNLSRGECRWSQPKIVSAIHRLQDAPPPKLLLRSLLGLDGMSAPLELLFALVRAGRQTRMRFQIPKEVMNNSYHTKDSR